MIVKMKFVNISGPRNDIDRVTDLYLSRYEIQLESALSELKTVDNLRPFVEINPYRDVLKKAEEYVGYLPDAESVEPDTSMGLDDMFEVVRKAGEDYQSVQEKKEKLKKRSDEIRAKQRVIAPFRRDRKETALEIISDHVAALLRFQFHRHADSSLFSLFRFGIFLQGTVAGVSVPLHRGQSLSRLDSSVHQRHRCKLAGMPWCLYGVLGQRYRRQVCRNMDSGHDIRNSRL